LLIQSWNFSYRHIDLHQCPANCRPAYRSG